MSPKAMALASLACFALVAICLAGAAALPSSTFDARVSMNTVDIRVSGAPAGRTLIYDDELLPYVATVTNSGQDCYLRIRATGETEDGDRFELALRADDPDWIPAPDGWTYYRPVFADGETTTATFEVGNPADPWDGRGMALDAHIAAEAIQASNFEPDYEAAQPWGPAQAQTTEHFRESE